MQIETQQKALTKGLKTIEAMLFAVAGALLAPITFFFDTDEANQASET